MARKRINVNARNLSMNLYYAVPTGAYCERCKISDDEPKIHIIGVCGSYHKKCVSQSWLEIAKEINPPGNTK